MMTRLRRLVHRGHAHASPDTEATVQRFRDARSDAINQTRASLRVQRALQALADPGLDYSNVNERAFSRLPKGERQ